MPFLPFLSVKSTRRRTSAEIGQVDIGSKILDVYYENISAMKIFFLFLYFVSLLVSIEGQIRKYPSGEALVQKIANGTVKFLNWRAAAAPIDEMRGLTTLFGWAAFALVMAFAIVRYIAPHTFPNTLSLMAFGSIALWSIFAVFRDYKKDWGRVAFMAVAGISFPWVLQLMGTSPLRAVVEPFHLLFSRAGYEVSDTLVLIMLSGLGLLSVVIMEVTALALPIATYLMLWISVKLSTRFLKEKPIWLYHLALLYFVVATMYYLVKSELG